MVMYNILTLNESQGIETVLVGISREVPFLIPGFLILIFFVIVGAGFFSEERRIGKGNFAMWATIASFITTVCAFILYLIPNLITIDTVIISVIVSIICTFWFLGSSNN